MRTALDFMKEMSFLKGDILFTVTCLTQWPHIWDFRQYALSTPRSCLNPKYGVTWHPPQAEYRLEEKIFPK
jgi:hypothetical protein